MVKPVVTKARRFARTYSCNCGLFPVAALLGAIGDASIELKSTRPQVFGETQIVAGRMKALVGSLAVLVNPKIRVRA
jgi:hypothetical protein